MDACILTPAIRPVFSNSLFENLTEVTYEEKFQPLQYPPGHLGSFKPVIPGEKDLFDPVPFRRQYLLPDTATGRTSPLRVTSPVMAISLLTGFRKGPNTSKLQE